MKLLFGLLIAPFLRMSTNDYIGEISIYNSNLKAGFDERFPNITDIDLERESSEKIRKLYDMMKKLKKLQSPNSKLEKLELAQEILDGKTNIHSVNEFNILNGGLMDDWVR